jgi:hypothetical protein
VKERTLVISFGEFQLCTENCLSLYREFSLWSGKCFWESISEVPYDQYSRPYFECFIRLWACWR